MGLSIHYSLKSAGTLDVAMEKVRLLREKAMDMSFEEVSEIAHFVGPECDYQRRKGQDDPWAWVLIQAMGNVQLKKAVDGSRYGVGGVSMSLSPLEAILFRTWPGEGCEEANFGLCRFPKSVLYEEIKFPTKLGTGWHWHSFCKTQYANERGILNFLRCHTLVVSMLDYAKELGILKLVHDEGEYWEKRNLKELVLEVGRWDQFVAGLAGMLEKVVGKDNLYSAIAENPRYERLKELGMQHLPEHAQEQLEEVFKLIQEKAS